MTLAKDLLDDPVPDEEFVAELLELSARQTQLAAQFWKKAKATPPQNGTKQADQLLSVEEAATRLNVSKAWLYRRSKPGMLPFVVHNGRKIAFSEKGIEEYIRKKQGKGT